MSKRRVLAVLVALLTAVWPLLLPPPTLGAPCANNADHNTGTASAGHSVDQSGAQSIFNPASVFADQSGNAGNGAPGAGGSGLGGAGLGGPGGPGGTGGSPSGGGATSFNNADAAAAAGPAIAAAANVGVGGGTQGPNTRNAQTNPSNDGMMNSDQTLRGGQSPDAHGQNGPVGGASAGGDPNATATRTAAAAAAPGATDGRSTGGDAASTGGAGGIGGAGSGATGFGGTGSGGSGGSNAARTVGSAGSRAGSLTKIASVAPAVAVAGFRASGDPCAQSVVDGTGVVAVNGVNNIQHSVLQAAGALIGNAANTAWNQPKLLLTPAVTPGVSVNPNLNFNANTNGNTTSVNIGISR
jgi:hypothetical protein